MTSISHIMGNLALGEYNFTILLFDEYGYNSTDTVIVTVISDTTPPVLTSADDVTMQLGETGLTIKWNATDDYPYTYLIYLDGAENGTGSWESNVPIVFSLDGLEAGVHNVTIAVRDVGNNIVTDTVIVQVIQPGYIPPEMLLLIIGGAVAAIVVVVIILKLRK
jgi:hypothetical protein